MKVVISIWYITWFLWKLLQNKSPLNKLGYFESNYSSPLTSGHQLRQKCTPMICHPSLHKLVFSDLYENWEFRVVGSKPLVDAVIVMITRMAFYSIQNDNSSCWGDDLLGQ